MERQLTGECNNCESHYTIAFVEEIVSAEIPEYCPFCGEIIEEINEDYIEDEDFNENDEWDT